MITPVMANELILLHRARKIGIECFQEWGVPGNFKFPVWYHTWLTLLTQNIGVMWKLELKGQIQGAIGGILAPDANDGELCAYEGFWFVSKEFRSTVWTIRLLEVFESWAREMECKRMHVAHLGVVSEKFGKFLSKRGMEMKEIVYVKQF